MSKILILYSSTDGHTIKICEHIARGLDGNAVTLTDVNKAPALEGFDKIVIGASIRYGYHSRAVHEFVQKHADILNAKRGVFFSVNLTARKPDKNTPQTNNNLKKFIKKVKWSPDLIEVFAGKVNYPKYAFHARIAIQFIMFLTRGPTNPSQVIEYTNWDKVDEFAQKIVNL